MPALKKKNTIIYFPNPEWSPYVNEIRISFPWFILAISIWVFSINFFKSLISFPHKKVLLLLDFACLLDRSRDLQGWVVVTRPLPCDRRPWPRSKEAPSIWPELSAARPWPQRTLHGLYCLNYPNCLHLLIITPNVRYICLLMLEVFVEASGDPWKPRPVLQVRGLPAFSVRGWATHVQAWWASGPGRRRAAPPLRLRTRTDRGAGPRSSKPRCADTEVLISHNVHMFQNVSSDFFQLVRNAKTTLSPWAVRKQAID